MYQFLKKIYSFHFLKKNLFTTSDLLPSYNSFFDLFKKYYFLNFYKLNVFRCDFDNQITAYLMQSRKIKTIFWINSADYFLRRK